MAQTELSDRAAVQPPANATNDNLHRDSGSQPVNVDPLAYSLKSMQTFSSLEEQLHIQPQAAKELADQRQAAIEAASALAAKNKLEQEVLLASPAEMRRLFPQVLKDMGLNQSDHLNMTEIDKGLKDDDTLNQTEKNFLTVLKAGFKEFSYGPRPTRFWMTKLPTDDEGISAGSLAMVDKAVNRGISEDPFFSDHAKLALEGSLFIGAAAAGWLAFRGADARAAAVGGAIDAGIMLVGTEGGVLYDKYFGREQLVYDQIKTDYQSFVADYEKGQTLPK